MSQITTGIRSILSHPVIYEFLQNIMGARYARELIVQQYIRPFPGMRILDLGCGTAEILSNLPKDIEYVGYDMSPEYIAAAQKKYGHRATFHCRLLEQAEIENLEKFDLVIGIGVLHHLDDAQGSGFMELAKSAMKPNGRVLTRDPVWAVGQNPLARFLISRDRGQHVRTQVGYETIGRTVFTNVNGWLTHQQWLPYTHWTMECRA